MRGSELPQHLVPGKRYETPSMEAKATPGTCKKPKCEHIQEPLQLPQLGKTQSLVTHRRPTPFINNYVYNVERWRNEVMEQVSNKSFHSSQQHPENRRPRQSRLLQRGRNLGNGTLLQLDRTPENETFCNINGSNKSEDTIHPTKGTERRVIRKMNSESQLSELKMKLARNLAERRRSSAFGGTQRDRFSGTF